jgi:hypothetical protein
MPSGGEPSGPEWGGGGFAVRDRAAGPRREALEARRRATLPTGRAPRPRGGRAGPRGPSRRGLSGPRTGPHASGGRDRRPSWSADGGGRRGPCGPPRDRRGRERSPRDRSPREGGPTVSSSPTSLNEISNGRNKGARQVERRGPIPPDLPLRGRIRGSAPGGEGVGPQPTPDGPDRLSTVAPGYPPAAGRPRPPLTDRLPTRGAPSKRQGPSS